MRERIWASFYIRSEISGGAEVMGEQYSKALNLRQFSAAKMGCLSNNAAEMSKGMEEFLRRIPDIELLVRNSTIGSGFIEDKPNIERDVVVCCEDFKTEAQCGIEDEMFVASKMVDHARQMKSLETADFVVVPSAMEAKNFADHGVPINKISVIEPYVDTDVFGGYSKERARELLGINKDSKMILFVGRAHPRKGFGAVLKAASKFTDTRFVSILSGVGVNPGMDNMRVLTNLDQSEVNLYYCASDAFFFPSRYEGYGLVSAEALTCGTPVITYATGLFWEKELDAFEWVHRGEYSEEAMVDMLGRFLDGEKRATAPPEFYNRLSKERFEKQCKELVG